MTNPREEQFKKVLAMDSNDAFVHLGLANLYLEENRVDEAIAEYNATLKIDPDYSIALLSLGEAFEKKGDLENARSNYQKAAGVADNRGDWAIKNKANDRLDRINKG